MIHSVKVHFAEQDINDLKEISATLERILTHPDEPEARRLEILKTLPLLLERHYFAGRCQPAGDFSLSRFT